MEEIDFLNKIKYEYILSFGTDKQKLFFASKCNNQYQIVNLVNEIVNEFLILEGIKYIKDKEERARIASCIKDDSIKEKVLSLIKGDDELFRVITSFKNNKHKVKYLHLLEDDNKKVYIANHLKNDYLAVECLVSINSESSKISLFNGIDDEYLKLKYITALNKEENRAKVISQFKYDNNKIEALNLIEKDYNRTTIIKSIKNDDKKKELLSSIKDNDLISEIISSFKNDDLKVSALTKIDNIFLRSKIISSFKSDDLKIKYLEIATDNYEKFCIIESLSNDNLKAKNLNKIDNIMIINNILYSLKNINKLDLDYDDLIKKNVLFYQLNYDHLALMHKLYGNIIFQYIDKLNFQRIIDLDENIFNKIINIFSSRNTSLDMDHLSNLNFIFAQMKFSQDYPDVETIFHQINECILQKDIDNLKFILKEVFSYVDEELVHLLVNNMEKVEDAVLNEKDLSNLLTQIHKITDKYIAKKREIYVKNEISQMTSSLNLEYKYDRNYVINYYIANFSNEEIISKLREIDNKIMIKEELELLNNPKLLINCLDFKRQKLNRSNKEFILKNKTNLGILQKLLIHLYDNDSFALVNIPDGVKKFYSVPESNFIRIMQILNQINVNKLKEKLLDDDELYNGLIYFLDKYRLLTINTVYKKIIDLINFNFDECNFITYFYDFYPKLVKAKKDGRIKEIRLIDLIRMSDIYGDSKYMSIIFDRDNYNFLVSNPSPNPSPLPRNERISQALNYIKTMYKRQYVGVPSFDEIIKLNNCQIEAVVGNVTNMINLTLGERTGACTRIGGVGDSLFNFCLSNDNGFLICFKKPGTNEFISKIHCYRNGNTVFFNQVRDSENENYSSIDIINATIKVAQMLIEKTRNSQMPIDNVCTSPTCAFLLANNKVQDIGIKSPTKGYGYFWSDVNSNCCLLATSNKNKLVPVVLDSKNVPKYPLLRDTVRSITTYEALEKAVNKIHLIEYLCDDKDIIGNDKKFDLITHSKTVAGYSGEDWYTYVNENREVVSYMMKKSLNNKCAILEMNKYIDILKSNIKGDIMYEKNNGHYK